jgi:hypothetical protein
MMQFTAENSNDLKVVCDLLAGWQAGRFKSEAREAMMILVLCDIMKPSWHKNQIETQNCS